MATLLQSVFWVKDWIMMTDTRLLKLEGSDLLLGWHAFVWYEKAKSHKYFTNHCIRKVLIQTWDKVRGTMYDKIPTWVSPVEAFRHLALMKDQRVLRYEDLLDEEGHLKSSHELSLQNIQIDW